MQARLLDVFVRLSQKALDKPREDGSPLSSQREAEDSRMSDASFAKLLKDIDTFSVELVQHASANIIPETPTGLPLSCGPKVGETTSFYRP